MAMHICTHDGCNATFSKPSLLKAHFFTHTDERPFICLYDNCEKKYTRSQHLKRHEALCHLKFPNALSGQSQQDSDPANLNHINNVGVSEEILTQPELKVTSYSPNNAPITSEKQLFSEVSGSTVEPSCSIKVNDDAKSQTNNKHMCTMPDCKSSFMSKEALEKHKKNYHDFRKFQCNACGIRFRKHQHLKVHSYIHTNIKPFKCDLCEKSFLIPSKLRSHRKIHAGYVCSQPNCCVKLEKWTEMRKHMKMMHPAEHLCPTCGKKFLNKSNLKTHVKVHEGEREAFHCPHDNCVRYYFYPTNLQQHIKSVHEGHRFKCEYDGCHKAYKKKKNLVQHEEIHKPGYVPPPKKIRRKRKPAPMAKKLSGIKSNEMLEKMAEFIHCTSISDIETEIDSSSKSCEEISSIAQFQNEICNAQECEDEKSVIKFKSNKSCYVES